MVTSAIRELLGLDLLREGSEFASCSDTRVPGEPAQFSGLEVAYPLLTYRKGKVTSWKDDQFFLRTADFFEQWFDWCQWNQVILLRPDVQDGDGDIRQMHRLTSEGQLITRDQFVALREVLDQLAKGFPRKRYPIQSPEADRLPDCTRPLICGELFNQGSGNTQAQHSGTREDERWRYVPQSLDQLIDIEGGGIEPGAQHTSMGEVE